jgi:hypothetical protein
MCGEYGSGGSVYRELAAESSWRYDLAETVGDATQNDIAARRESLANQTK